MSESEADSVYVYVSEASVTGDLDLDCVRRFLSGDVYARFRRARGDTVLFPFGVQSHGEAVEREATQRGVPAATIVDSFVEEVRRRFESLAISCDWSGTAASSELGQRRCLQLIFLKLLDEGLVYRQGAGTTAANEQWFLRAGQFAAACDQSLDGLAEWPAAVIAGQREALGSVTGVEVDAAVLGLGEFRAFTDHPDAITDAKFVSISPRSTEATAVAPPAEVEKLAQEPKGSRFLLTDFRAVVPGVEDLLPVVVTTCFDLRYGAGVALGIPTRDPAADEIAGRIDLPGGLSLQAVKSRGKARPAMRYRLADWAISSEASLGIPIPVLWCKVCGAVPATVEDGSGLLGTPADGTVGMPDQPAWRCPRCGAEATPDSQTLDQGFEEMWMWFSACASGDDAFPPSLEVDSARWLPARRAVGSEGEDEGFLRRRLAGPILERLGVGILSEHAEPFAWVSLHGSVRTEGDGAVGGDEELAELIASEGADVVRFGILHAGSSGRKTSWSPHLFRHARHFVSEFRRYAQLRIQPDGDLAARGIDRSSRLRRRLAAWCAIATEKVTADLESLEMGRATHNLILFLTRIQDFEARCTDENGNLAPADRDAIAIALSNLIQLAKPCIPDACGELARVIVGAERSSANK